MSSVSRKRIGEHVFAATDRNKAIELLLETVFPVRYVQSSYNEDNWEDPVGWKSGCEEKTLYVMQLQ
jgi:hypothetical protein